MLEKVWELSCPDCADGKVQIIQVPSRAEIDAMLPHSMRMPAIGPKQKRRRFEGHESCSGCGFDANDVAKAVETDGLPDDAREIAEPG